MSRLKQALASDNSLLRSDRLGSWRIVPSEKPEAQRNRGDQTQCHTNQMTHTHDLVLKTDETQQVAIRVKPLTEPVHDFEFARESSESQTRNFRKVG